MFHEQKCYSFALFSRKLSQLDSAPVKVPPHNQPHTRFIGKEESRRVAASRVRSSNKLNRMQRLYRVSCVGLCDKLRDWWDFKSLVLVLRSSQDQVFLGER